MLQEICAICTFLFEVVVVVDMGVLAAVVGELVASYNLQVTSYKLQVTSYKLPHHSCSTLRSN
jgi:hypothetical protein